MFLYNGKTYLKEVKDDLFSCFVPNGQTEKILEIADVSPIWHGKGHISFQQWREMLNFFYWGYEKTRSEQLITIFYNPTTREFLFYPFPQYCVGMTVREDEHKKTEARTKHIPDGYVFFGTVHHHCNSSAFQSTVDEKDEGIGFHATIGHISSDVHSLHTRWVTRDQSTGQKITHENSSKDDTKGLNMFSLFNPLIEKNEFVNTKDLFSLIRKELTIRTEGEFPESWKESIMERNKVIAYSNQSIYGGLNYLDRKREAYTTITDSEERTVAYEDDWFYDQGYGYYNYKNYSNEDLQDMIEYTKSLYPSMYETTAKLDLEMIVKTKINNMSDVDFARFVKASRDYCKKKSTISIDNIGIVTPKNQVKVKRVYDSWLLEPVVNSISYHSSYYKNSFSPLSIMFDSTFYGYEFELEHEIAKYIANNNKVHLHAEVINGTSLFPIRRHAVPNPKTNTSELAFSTFATFEYQNTKKGDLIAFTKSDGEIGYFYGEKLDNDPLFLLLFIDAKTESIKTDKDLKDAAMQLWDSRDLDGVKHIPKHTLVFSILNLSEYKDNGGELKIEYSRYFANTLVEKDEKYGEGVNKQHYRTNPDVGQPYQDAVCREFEALLADDTEISSHRLEELFFLNENDIVFDDFLNLFYGIKDSSTWINIMEEMYQLHPSIFPYLRLQPDTSLAQTETCFARTETCLTLTKDIDIEELLDSYEQIWASEKEGTLIIMFLFIRATCLANIKLEPLTYDTYDAILLNNKYSDVRNLKLYSKVYSKLMNPY